jgi:hypothetical protein
MWKQPSRRGEMIRITRTLFELVIHYPLSLWGGERHRRRLDGVGVFFMFIGYPRCGHTLIGSLLDAHPNILCAHELGVLKYVHARFRKRQIYYLLMKNSEAFTREGRRSRGYSYRVSNQWQGRCDDLIAIGDKNASGAALRLAKRPWLLDRHRDVIGGRRTFFHVLRNPYDNISTICNKHGMSLQESISYYFFLCETVNSFRRRIPASDWFDLRHEAFVSDPKFHLKTMCLFLGVPASDPYLDDCARIVFNAPKRTRYEAPWNGALLDRVVEGIRRFPYLEGYAYEE